jgi:hypothetical protein
MIDSPQILELNDAEFRLIVSIWCLCNDGEELGKCLYTVKSLRRRIAPNRTENDIKKMIDHLKSLDLIRGEDGDFEIPRWKELQYQYESKTPNYRAEQRKLQKDLLKEQQKTSSKCGEVMVKCSGSNSADNGKTETETETEIYKPVKKENLRERKPDNHSENDALDAEKPHRKTTSSEFDTFWKMYPRKVGKEAARRKFEAIVKQTPSEKIIDGLQRATEYWKIRKIETQFIPHPTTWLNQGRWDDVYDTGSEDIYLVEKYGKLKTITINADDDDILEID